MVVFTWLIVGDRLRSLVSLTDNKCLQFPLSPSLVGSEEECVYPRFKCAGGPCIPKDWICDGTLDCEDGSDEAPTNCKNESPDRLYTSMCVCLMLTTYIPFARQQNVPC